MNLSIEAREQGPGVVRVLLFGDVDYDTAPALRANVSALLASGQVDTIVVDLGGVTLLDSTGIGTLVVAHRICAEMGVDFKVCEANAFIRNLFTVLGVAEMLGLPAAVGLRPRRRLAQASSGHWYPATSAPLRQPA